MRKLIVALVFYMMSGFGISLTILANIGVSSFNSLNLSLANLTNIKIGTMTMMVNGLFLIGYIILTKGRYLRKYLMQSGSVLMLGQVINFFTYIVFRNIQITHYALALLVFLSGTIIAGFGTGMVLNLGYLSFPIESLCNVLAERYNIPFTRLRYGVDVFSVSCSLLISFVTHSPVYVREGTLISLVALSLTIGTTKRMYEKRNLDLKMS
ncbi:YitT family protein [Erysipelothrix sp. HDW6C]|uniref:YczE/YyaS/YitT family protein n=1 Tax=Erysipelothrix sp. HDW6C TaxID=2714930 RepID=UPI00196A2F97|nr:hypothetical protein [Erysipelothrix sp. HDW6C]